jgi:predicted phage terminase large subunit-like protein
VLGMPKTARRCRAWDKAGTKDDGDYSAGCRLSMTADGIVYVEDVQRGQWSSGARNKVMKQTAVLDTQQFGIGVVKVRVEQEPGSGGKESAEISVKDLAGHDVETHRSTGDKVTRARPFAAQCEAGNVRLVAGDWNGAYLDELANFPNGANDDQVDASADAFNELALGVGEGRMVKVTGI